MAASEWQPRTAAQPGAGERQVSPLRATLPGLLLDAALPYATYLLLRSWDESSVVALSVGAVFPAANVALTWARRRHLDGLGLFVLVLLALGAAASLISGDSRFILLKESAFTGAFGLAMLGSLAARRPLMFYSGLKFATDGSPEARARWDGYWAKSATFRSSNRMMTAVWGVAFVLEALVRVALVYTLAESTVVGISQVMPIAVVAALITWTSWYGWRTRPASRAEVVAYEAAHAAG